MICQECRDDDAQRVEKAAARKRAKDAFRDMIASQRKEHIDAPHISEVCAAMIRELGGLDRFCAGLVEDYLDARERSPGSSTLLRFGTDIFRLARDSSSLRDSAPDAVNMTDEELASEVLALLDHAAKQRKIQEAEEGILGLLEGESDSDQRGSGESEDGAAGDGGESPAAGGAEVLPPD
jgi:hypothetical protein